MMGVRTAKSCSTVLALIASLPAMWKTTLLLACWSFLAIMSATLKDFTTSPTDSMGRSRRNLKHSTRATNLALNPLSTAPGKGR